MKKNKPRLQQEYLDVIRPKLMEQLGIKNLMAIPQLKKIVINVGVKDAVGDSKALGPVQETLAQITGQLPVRTSAKKSIAGFKLRQGTSIGVKVTLRRQRMYEFLDRLINLALPKTRDFRGVKPRFDGRGNYNLGIKEWIIFPEIDYNMAIASMRGMNITFETSAKKDEHAHVLLAEFGMPFKKQVIKTK